MGEFNHSRVLSTFVRFSLRFKGTIVALAMIFLGYSLYSLSKAKYDVFPEFAPPQVIVHSEAPGLSPEQVELLVTRPIEAAINGVQGIESMRSSSIQGFSSITVTFRTGSDIYLVRQMVAERLASVAGQLPEGIGAPEITPLTSSTDVVLALGMTSDRLSLMDLRTIADWTIKPTILAVPGVAKMAIFGGDIRQLQVQVFPDKLIKYGISLDDLLTAARRATAIRGTGFVDTENQRLTLQTEGRPQSAGQIARSILLHKNEANVTLGDVANVVYAPKPAIGAGTIMGKPGVLMVVSAQYGANTVEVTKRLEQTIGELRPSLVKQGIRLYPALFRPADFVETAIGNVRSSLFLGGILVVIILFLFLFNLRTAAISCAAIPLSLLAAVTVLERLGYSLNTMTLGGLAIAIGEVVDDAVIDVENIFRRLKENRRSDAPRPVLGVIFDASLEVRSAVVYATFAVVLVFVPVLTISGVMGRIFGPLGVAYILAILASLCVALTVTPALCLLLLGGKDIPEKEAPLARLLREHYRSYLLRTKGRQGIIIALAAVLVVFVLATLPFLKGDLLPELREGNFIVHMTAVPGTSLDESLRMGSQVTDGLLKLPFVRSVAQRVGRAEESEETRGANSGEFNVGLKTLTGSEAERASREVRKVMDQFPGITYAVKTFLSERIEETISGYTASTVVNIFGNDLDILAEKSREVAAALGGVRGAREVQVQSPPESPQLVVRLREADMARWGFWAGDVIGAMSTAYQGAIVSQVYEGDRVIDVSVVLDREERGRVTGIGSLPLRNASGTYVFLRQIADIYETPGRFIITHDGGRRVQTVTCNISGRDYNSFMADATRQISSNVSFPAGTYVQLSGAAVAQSQSRRDLIVHSLLAALGILILLSVVVDNYRNLFLLILNLPFALAGGVLVVLLASGGRLSIGGMVGFVTLFGITLRNSIMLISHYEHLVSAEGMAWGPETALRGASERLVPILMTALVTAFGLLPLAVGSGTAGREIEGPMAQVILGGLVSSTALNLLVLPVLALKYGRFNEERKIDSGDGSP